MRAREKRRRGISLKIVVIILCGIVISLSGAAMWVSKSFNLNRFFDVGKVYDVRGGDRNVAGTGVPSVLEKGTYVFDVTEETAVKRIVVQGSMVPWQILILELDNLNRDDIEWQLRFFDNTEKLVYTETIRLKEGENIVKLQKRNFAIIEIRIFNQLGSEFSIEKIQLLEGDKIISAQQYLGISLIFFAMYLLIIYVCHWIRRNRRRQEKGRKNPVYIFIFKLQDIYCKAGSMLPNFGEIYPKKYISLARRILLLGMLYYMLVINSKDTYFNPRYFPRHVAIWALFLIAIGALCKEKSLEKQNWNTPFMRVWHIFWLMICMSDFIVKKRLCGWGYLMLFAADFLLFMWRNMEKPEEFERDIIKSVEWYSVINLVFCLICRPKMGGYAYIGIAWNANIYVQYLMPMAVVFFAEADAWIREKKRGKVCFYAVMTVCCYYLGWLSQSRTTLLALGVILLLFLIKQVRNVALFGAKKRVFGFIVVVCIIGAPVADFSNWCINNVAQNLGTQVIFPRDDRKTEVKMPSLSLETQAAGKVKESRVVQSFLKGNDIETLTSGRNLYWKAYLRDMNLWGHEYQLEIWGGGRGEHSGFITIAYRYGVLAIVPYLIIIGYFIKYAWRYMKKREDTGEYPFYPIGIAAGMVCILLVENVERPFYSVACLAFWLLPGFLMENNSEKDRENLYVEEQYS